MADILRVTLYGQLPSGEEWSVNPVFLLTGPGDVFSYSECLAAANGINTIAIPTAVRNMLTSTCNFQGVRVEARHLTGVLEAQAESVRALPLTGSGSDAHPFQTSLVLSLRTSTPGPSGRGRLYIPATGVAITSATLRPSAADVTSFLSGWKSYLDLIKAQIELAFDETPWQLAVWSRKTASAAPVMRYMMGDVLDTQRRRRDSLPETYQELSAL